MKNESKNINRRKFLGAGMLAELLLQAQGH